MRIKVDFMVANKVRIHRDEGVSLACSSETEDGNTMRVKSVIPHLLMRFCDDVVADVMHERMTLSRGEVTIGDGDCTIFMGLGHPTSDVDHPPGTAERVPIFQDHAHWGEGIRVNNEVRHGGRRSGGRG
jgi:hypothetical protein